ncbi:amidoligase family protein [Nocardia abscessus]|uniref:amidoligase family protein n=1 Tax=Nocardia abscessus TaxID=120957 RepID=UPI001E60979A|nr:amidoligase family protein [Nocardia abscessus]
MTETADERQLCAECVTGWLPCVSCRVVTNPRVRTDTDEPVCLRCAAVLFDLCYQCSRYSATSRYVSGGHRACGRCVDRFDSCPDCGTLTRRGRSCECRIHREHVWHYSYKPDPRFHGEGPLYLGMELEVIVPDHRYSEAVSVVGDHLGRLGYLKQDSSIHPTGFELVTHPMSYRYAIERFPWPLLGALEELDCETDSTVGLHVHASRDGFDSPAHVYRWMKLLYRNESAVSTLARRRSPYAPFDRTARARVKDTAKGPQHAVGLARNQAINPYPRKTLELRVFASSLDVVRVQAALAFTAASIDYTRRLRVSDVRAGGWDWARFAAWVHTQPDYQPLWAQMEDLACAC